MAALASVPRVVYLVQMWADSPTFFAPEGGDSIFYDRVAATDFRPDRAYFHSPLYEWFLSGVYGVAGRDLIAVRLLQHVIGVIGAVLVTDVGWRVFRRRPPAVVGGVLYAVAGPPIFYEGHLLVDALVPFLTIATVWLALRAHDRPTPARVGLLGVAIGIATLGRGTFLLWLPVVVWLMWRSPPWRGWRPAGLLLGAAVVIAPVTIRNYLVERDLVLTAANAGLNLYIGNNERAHGAYVLPPGLWFRAGDPGDDFRGLNVATEALGHPPRSSELSRWWARRAVDHAVHHPIDTLDVTLAKARLTLSDYEFPQLYHYYGYQAVAPVLGWLPSAGWLLAPGMIGAAILRRRFAHDGRVRLFLSLLAVQAASFLPFFVVGRYRVALLVFAGPLAGLAIAGAIRRWRHAFRRGRMKGAGFVAVCLVVVFWPPPASFHAAPQYDAFGEECERAGDRKAARAWYTRAVEENAAYDPALHRLVRLLLVAGETTEAEYRLVTALRNGSRASRTYQYLGEIQHQSGELEFAEESFRAAIGAEPGNIAAWRGYAELLVELSRLDDARSALESAAALESDPQAATQLRDRALRIGL